VRGPACYSKPRNIVLRAQLLIHVVAPCRYSNSSIFNHISRSHRGEPLFKEARNALKENFDHQSLTTIQVYTLLSTYHLTFGGARKAWLYLGRSLAEPISGMSWLILTRNGQQLGQESWTDREPSGGRPDQGGVLPEGRLYGRSHGPYLVAISEFTMLFFFAPMF
jgi:hypothetical protein